MMWRAPLAAIPLDVRIQNLYGDSDRNTTHYHQQIEHFTVPKIIQQLEAECDYRARRESITAFNRNNAIVKKGLALTPVKFGISFTVNHLNQAGALIHIYTDGSIHLNHGGTEMGQGLYTKVAQIVADVFSVDVNTVGISAARTDKVPNTSPTAASSGTDINGMAALNAATTIRQRLIDFSCEHFSVDSTQVVFCNNQVHIGEQTISFPELANLAYLKSGIPIFDRLLPHTQNSLRSRDSKRPTVLLLRQRRRLHRNAGGYVNG